MGWRSAARFRILGGVLGGGLVVSACSTSTTNGPAWPKPHLRDRDGGESLAPHVARAIAAREVEVETPQASSSPQAAALITEIATPIVVPIVSAPEDVITTEDIVIEIEE